MSVRTPWVKIRDANDEYLVSNARHPQYNLDDPSRMSENAVHVYLHMWYNHQESGKEHALLFRNPELSAESDKSKVIPKPSLKVIGKQRDFGNAENVDNGGGENLGDVWGASLNGDAAAGATQEYVVDTS